MWVHDMKIAKTRIPCIFYHFIDKAYRNNRQMTPRSWLQSDFLGYRSEGQSSHHLLHILAPPNFLELESQSWVLIMGIIAPAPWAQAPVYTQKGPLEFVHSIPCECGPNEPGFCVPMKVDVSKRNCSGEGSDR